jgi:RES domain-containing protein
MRVWRLCRRVHAAFDGEGARRYGGRWHQRGTAVAYASASASLAALEYFVHLEPEDAPEDLVLIPADVPDGLAEELPTEQLPSNWRSLPALEPLAQIGTRWAQQLRSPVLSVPSAVMPFERNFLLNPAHPDFHSIVVDRPTPFSFDPRMWKSARTKRRRTR